MLTNLLLEFKELCKFKKIGKSKRSRIDQFFLKAIITTSVVIATLQYVKTNVLDDSVVLLH